MRIPEDSAVSRVGGDPQEPFAGELHPIRVVANNRVLEHLAGERELAVRGYGRENGEEKKNEYQCVSHARNVAPRSPEVLRIG